MSLLFEQSEDPPKYGTREPEEKQQTTSKKINNHYHNKTI
jgi:hypothetical protein